MDDSTIIYTENTNSAGCQTWRSRSKWAATRRDCNKPCSDHQQRDRRNVNTVHIDIKEPQIDSPPSK
jgi:hypothetical protein